MKYCYCLLLLLVAGTACVSLGDNLLSAPYYLAPDPAAPYKTLYYRGPDGLDFERIPAVRRAGYTADFIFVESARGFYVLDRAQDQAADRGSPAVQPAIRGPFSAAEFPALLDRLGIPGFTFQYSGL